MRILGGKRFGGKVAAALAATAWLSTAGLARGEVRPDVTRVYEDADVGPTSALAEVQVKQVCEKCQFEIFSRRGPDPAEIAACDASVKWLEKSGPKAYAAIFDALDEPDVAYPVRQRLYELLARTDDRDVTDALLSGMARIASRDLEDRYWELEMIRGALRTLTGAPVDEEVPWESHVERSDRREAFMDVADFRLWLAAHPDASLKELREGRHREAAADVASDVPERMFRGARYLLEFHPAEGVLAAERVKASDRLPTAGTQELDWRLDEARWKLEQGRRPNVEELPVFPLADLPEPPVAVPPAAAAPVLGLPVLDLKKPAPKPAPAKSPPVELAPPAGGAPNS